MCLSDRISGNIQNPTQKQALQKEGLGLKKIVFDLEDTKEEVCGKLTSSKTVMGLNYCGMYLTVEYWKALNVQLLLKHLKHLLAKE